MKGFAILFDYLIPSSTIAAIVAWTTKQKLAGDKALVRRDQVKAKSKAATLKSEALYFGKPQSNSKPQRSRGTLQAPWFSVGSGVMSSCCFHVFSVGFPCAFRFDAWGFACLDCFFACCFCALPRALPFFKHHEMNEGRSGENRSALTFFFGQICRVFTEHKENRGTTRHK